MPRVALGIEYDGSAFRGWQQQAQARSVQGELQRALERVATHRVELTAAGRTDAGVHAALQVAHFDANVERPLRAWVMGANAAGPADLSVLWARPVPDTFHARHDALSRTYRYEIVNRPVRAALERERACWVRRPLDAAAMHAAAQCLLGERDFSAFRSSECQSPTPMRRVLAIAVAAAGGRVRVEVTANAFLHHMVRNIVGSLLPVGLGLKPAAWLAEVLASRDRRLAGPTAPPQGLYLVGVEYPAPLQLPSRPA